MVGLFNWFWSWVDKKRFNSSGLVKQRRSKKDYLYEDHFKIAGSSNELSIIDNFFADEKPLNQRTTELCVGFVGRSRLERLMREVSGQKHRRASILFTHYFTRLKHGWAGENRGVSIRYYLQTLFKVGFVFESTMSFKKDYLRKPQAEDVELGQFIKERYLKDYEYYLVQPKNVREALKDGYTLFIGLPLNESFYNNKTGLVKDMPPNNYLHCMELGGCDDATRLYKHKNSWGYSGDEGMFYIPYDYFEKHAFDCWVLRKK